MLPRRESFKGIESDALWAFFVLYSPPFESFQTGFNNQKPLPPAGGVGERYTRGLPPAIPHRESFKGIRSDALWAFFVLYSPPFESFQAKFNKQKPLPPGGGVGERYTRGLPPAIPRRGSFKGIRSDALWAFFVLFKALTIASIVRTFHKTKDPPASWRTGLI
jgi:hypothetical protein